MVEAVGSKFKLHNTLVKLSNATTQEALNSEWVSFKTTTSRKQWQGFLGCTPAMSHGDRNKDQNRTHCLLAVC